MKATITETKEVEIDVTYPSFYRDPQFTPSLHYYMLLSDTWCVQITTRATPSLSERPMSPDYTANVVLKCTQIPEEEFQQAFDETLAKLQQHLLTPA